MIVFVPKSGKKTEGLAQFFNGSHSKSEQGLEWSLLSVVSAQKILSKYLLRWPIETFYRDGKQLLGLDKYQMRTVEAIQSHWCLVFVAYSILHLACLPPPPKKGQSQRSAVPVKTIGQVCRQQGQEVVKKLILFAHERLQDGITAAEVFSQLFEKQNKEVLMA